jgi:twitching motility protein PilT
LRGIICQKQLPKVDGTVALACEVLVKNMAVAALIRDGKQQGLSNVMETGKREGMVQMDATVMQLYRDGQISAETARANVGNVILRRYIDEA